MYFCCFPQFVQVAVKDTEDKHLGVGVGGSSVSYITLILKSLHQQRYECCCVMLKFWEKLDQCRDFTQKGVN